MLGVARRENSDQLVRSGWKRSAAAPIRGVMSCHSVCSQCSAAPLKTTCAQGSAPRLFVKGDRGERGQEFNEDLRRTTP